MTAPYQEPASLKLKETFKAKNKSLKDFAEDYAALCCAGPPSDELNDNSSVKSNKIYLFCHRHIGITERQLIKLIQKSQEHGWNRIYVYGPDGKSPHLRLASEIQSTIAKLGLEDQIQCCTKAEDYAGYKSANDVVKQCKRQGATEGWDKSIMGSRHT